MVVAVYVVVVYDVGIERVNAVRQFLRRYLIWIQNSAFEGEISEGQMARIKAGIREIINEDEDSVIIFTVGSKKWIGKEVLGIEKAETSPIL